MPGVVDVLLKIMGDNRDAVQSVKQVGDEAEKTTVKVNQLQQSIRAWASVIGQAVGLGVVAIEGVQRAAQQADEFLGLDQAPSVAGATSAQDTARRIQQAGRARFTDFARSAGGVELLSRFGIDLPFSGRAQAQTRTEAAIEELARSNPAQLQGALPFLSERQQGIARAALAELESAAAYQESLQPAKRGGGATVIVNTGVGDRNQIGREVRSALDARDRNNGRYVTTYTRR